MRFKKGRKGSIRAANSLGVLEHGYILTSYSSGPDASFL